MNTIAYLILVVDIWLIAYVLLRRIEKLEDNIRILNMRVVELMYGDEKNENKSKMG